MGSRSFKSVLWTQKLGDSITIESGEFSLETIVTKITGTRLTRRAELKVKKSEIEKKIYIRCRGRNYDLARYAKVAIFRPSSSSRVDLVYRIPVDAKLVYNGEEVKGKEIIR